MAARKRRAGRTPRRRASHFACMHVREVLRAREAAKPRIQVATQLFRKIDSCSREDCRGSSAAESAGRVERINAEKLVPKAASHTEHCGAAIIALSI